MPLSTYAHRQEVKIVLYSIWYHHKLVNIKINILRCTVSKISKFCYVFSTLILFSLLIKIIHYGARQYRAMDMRLSYKILQRNLISLAIAGIFFFPSFLSFS